MTLNLGEIEARASGVGRIYQGMRVKTEQMHFINYAIEDIPALIARVRELEKLHVNQFNCGNAIGMMMGMGYATGQDIAAERKRIVEKVREYVSDYGLYDGDRGEAVDEIIAIVENKE